MSPIDGHHVVEMMIEGRRRGLVDEQLDLELGIGA